MAARAGILITGTEVLTGRVTDRNGPWLAERLRTVGLDVGRIVVVGDRPDDLAEALRQLTADHDLVLTSGGLGPTADDLTADVVARVQGRPSALDEALETRIAAIVERLLSRRRWPSDPVAVAAGTRKQAMVPEGAFVLEPVGTAPGLVVPPAEGCAGPPVVVLPGPPAELRGMWPAVLTAPAVRAVLDRTMPLLEDTVRLWGTLEADLAAVLRRVEPDLLGLEVSTCLRDGELEIVTRYRPEAAPALDLLRRTVLDAFAGTAFSPDGATVDDLVAAALTAHGWTVAAAEAGTGAALAARLAQHPGIAARLQGASVHGDGPAGSSVDAALALAQQARRTAGAEVGVAALGNGTAVHLAVDTATGARHRTIDLPSDVEQARRRAAVAALHELRLALT